MLKDKLKRADLLLLLFYVIYCAFVVLRVHVEATGYTSPDSEYYLEAARSLKDGENFIIRDLYGLHTGTYGAYTPFTAWPIGYPIIIYIASAVTPLNLFWASKLVNLLFAGCGFLLIRRINRQYSYVLASIYGAFSIIEMYSYTWSEGPFMFGCLCFAYLLYCLYKGDRQNRIFILLLITATGMFLLRYIGIFTIGFLALAIVFYYYLQQPDISKKLLLVLLLTSAFVGAYLVRNYFLIGHPTGIARLTEDMETIGQLAVMTIKAITGELFIIRRYYFRGSPDALTIVTFLIEMGLLLYIIQVIRKQGTITPEFKQNYLSHICLLTAFLYLVLLVILRSISRFDPINYRLLSPFTFLVLFALVHYVVALPDRIKGVKRVKYLLFAFFLLSLLLNLPKAYLISKLS